MNIKIKIGLFITVIIAAIIFLFYTTKENEINIDENLLENSNTIMLKEPGYTLPVDSVQTSDYNAVSEEMEFDPNNILFDNIAYCDLNGDGELENIVFFTGQNQEGYDQGKIPTGWDLAAQTIINGETFQIWFNTVGSVMSVQRFNLVDGRQALIVVCGGNVGDEVFRLSFDGQDLKLSLFKAVEEAEEIACEKDIFETAAADIPIIISEYVDIPYEVFFDNTQLSTEENLKIKAMLINIILYIYGYEIDNDIFSYAPKEELQIHRSAVGGREDKLHSIDANFMIKPQNEIREESLFIAVPIYNLEKAYEYESGVRGVYEFYLEKVDEEFVVVFFSVDS